MSTLINWSHFPAAFDNSDNYEVKRNCMKSEWQNLQ